MNSKEVSTELHNECKEIFMEIYAAKIGVEYYWHAKDAGAINGIIRQIRVVAKISDDNGVIATLRYILNNLPKWYLENAFSTVVINKNFNQIVALIKKEKEKTVSDVYTTEWINNLKGNE